MSKLFFGSLVLSFLAEHALAFYSVPPNLPNFYASYDAASIAPWQVPERVQLFLSPLFDHPELALAD